MPYADLVTLCRSNSVVFAMFRLHWLSGKHIPSPNNCAEIVHILLAAGCALSPYGCVLICDVVPWSSALMIEVEFLHTKLQQN